MRFRDPAMPSLRVLLLFLPVALVVGAMAACTTAPPSGKPVTGLAPVEADSLLAQARRDFTRADYAAAELKSRDLIERSPDYQLSDEVFLLAARASHAAGVYTQTVKYAEAAGERYPLSPHREAILLLGADANRQLGRYFEAADMYLRVLTAPADDSTRDPVMTPLRQIAQEHLSASEIDRLVERYPGSPLASEMSLGLAKKEFARGDYDRAYRLLTDLLYEFPGHKRAREVRQLLQLAAQRREDPDRVSGPVEPYRIGLIVPQTGNYARFGRYFEEGVDLAAKDLTTDIGFSPSFVTADSKGGAVEAVAAARRLIVEDGVSAIMGGVFSVPTIAATIESNAWKVPILSPVVSDPAIETIGPWVFQTQIGKEVEVTSMAELARRALMLDRFAILAPDTDAGRRLSTFFAEQVRAMGAEVVADQYYNRGDTDFKDQLAVIRDAAPDALFIPGQVEELIQLLPQVSFYDMQVQLLGLSEWNSEQLLRLSRRELEGALFPRAAHFGRDYAATLAFRQRYEQVYGSEPHAVAEASYFGTRLLIQAMADGAVDRAQLRTALEGRLREPSEMATLAESLAIVRVRSGKLTDFTAHRR